MKLILSTVFNVFLVVSLVVAQPPRRRRPRPKAPGGTPGAAPGTAPGAAPGPAGAAGSLVAAMPLINPMGANRPWIPGMTAAYVTDLMNGRPGPVPVDIANEAAAMRMLGWTPDHISDVLGDKMQQRVAMQRMAGNMAMIGAMTGSGGVSGSLPGAPVAGAPVAGKPKRGRSRKGRKGRRNNRQNKKAGGRGTGGMGGRGGMNAGMMNGAGSMGGAGLMDAAMMAGAGSMGGAGLMDAAMMAGAGSMGGTGAMNAAMFGGAGAAGGFDQTMLSMLGGGGGPMANLGTAPTGLYGAAKGPGLGSGAATAGGGAGTGLTGAANLMNPMGINRPFVPGMTPAFVSDLMNGRPGPVPLDIANQALSLRMAGFTPDHISDVLGDAMQRRFALQRTARNMAMVGAMTGAATGGTGGVGSPPP